MRAANRFEISAKETDKLEYCLRLYKSFEQYPDSDEKLLKDLKSVILIISKIIVSSKTIID
jgi:hypothetical protein